MPAITRIVFWQPIDSPHQDALLDAIAERFHGEVILGVEQPLPAFRAAQGWRTPAHRLVKVVDISRPAAHAALVAHGGPDTLHVFSGFFSHPLVWAGFRRLAPSRARLAIYSEAPEQPPAWGWLKRLRGRFLTARWASRVALVLAVGTVGCEFFSRIGVPAEKIVPFGYFLDAAPLPEADSRDPADTTFRLLSAGQLIPRKGIDLLIGGCAALPREGWRLDIHGDGPARSALEAQAARLGLADRIVFRGGASNDAIQRLLAAADCAVLPSRFDGWGMLVNEALAVGTPVICTDRCGAAALPGMCGIAAPVCRPTSGGIARALAAALAEGRPSPGLRFEIAAAVRDRGSATAGAERFLGAAVHGHAAQRSAATA